MSFSWLGLHLGWQYFAVGSDKQIPNLMADLVTIASDNEVSSGVALLMNHSSLVNLALPFGFALLGAAALAILMRSMVYLFGPGYLKNRAASHVIISEEEERTITECKQYGMRG